MYLYIIQVLVITVFIPLVIIYLLIAQGKVDSIMVSKVSQRKIPILIHIGLVLFLTNFTITRNVMPILYYFFLGNLISSFIALVMVYFSKKASLHMLGISSLTAFTIGLCLHFQVKEVIFLSVIILLNGCIATSRLYMKAHSVKELILGYLTGFISQLFIFYFWL